MSRLKKARLDQHLAALCAREPYFAPSFAAARVLLNASRVGNGSLMWSSGARCGARGCSCGDRGCLHAVAWRLYQGGRP